MTWLAIVRATGDRSASLQALADGRAAGGAFGAGASRASGGAALAIAAVAARDACAEDLVGALAVDGGRVAPHLRRA